jgi:hypothetical protein
VTGHESGKDVVLGYGELRDMEMNELNLRKRFGDVGERKADRGGVGIE